MTAHHLTRELILATAFDLLETGGADAVTMRAIGRQLDVDPTAAYRHFANKDSIVLAMLESLLDDRLRDDPAVGTPEERLLAVARVVRAVLMAYPSSPAA